MRTPHNDRALTPPSMLPPGTLPGAGDTPVAGPGTVVPAARPPKPVRKQRDPDGDGNGAERRCILSGVHDARGAMTRLALSPDGVLAPDVLARAPGRGAWIGVDRATLEKAMTKGKIRGAVARAFKGARVAVPDDLPALIDAAFLRSVLAQFGMAAKAGVLLTGAEKVDAAARSGQVALLAHASDAADDGRRKRDQSWRVGEDREGSGVQGRVLPVDRTALSVALGRDNAVHLALTDPVWAGRVGALLDRWAAYAGMPPDECGQDDSGPGDETGDDNENAGDAGKAGTATTAV